MPTYGGIDLGGTKIQAIIRAGSSEEILGQARIPTPTAGGPPAVVAALSSCLQEAASDAGGMSTEKLDRVGIGSPGQIDTDAGTIAQAGNLPGWRKPFPVAEALSERVGTSVSIGNDVDLATLAELELGAGRGLSSLLGIFWGTGIGGAVVLDGELWRGRGGAGEIGHAVVRQGGARCPCGRRGCLEAYAGRGPMEARARRKHREGHPTELFEIMAARGRPRLASGVWAEALKRGDGLAEELIDRALEAMATGVASAVNILDLELVILGGGLGSRFGQPMADRLSEAMLPHLFYDNRPPPVLVAALGDLGGAIGAAIMAERPSELRRIPPASPPPGSPTASS